jgi:acid stress-induced BolA-like protein IbaG/YrbA
MTTIQITQVFLGLAPHAQLVVAGDGEQWKITTSYFGVRHEETFAGTAVVAKARAVYLADLAVPGAVTWEQQEVK